MFTPFISSIFFLLAALLCLVSLIGGGAALILFATQLDDIKLKTWTLALIGFPYAVMGTVFLCCLVRRTTRMRYQLHKIPKNHIAVREREIPNRVRSYIQAEYFRAAAIAYITQPPLVDHPGWLSIENQAEPIFIRRALLDSVPTVDAYARLVLPNLPPVKPHTRLVEHFRTLGFTLPDLVTPIRIYDTIIEHARYSSEEPTVLEYRRALEAMDVIIQGCEENRVDQSEMSSFITAPSVST